MRELQRNVRIEYIPDISELPEEEAVLVSASRKAAETSYSPYSKFAVGAAILLANGEIVAGSNQENAASPSGLCAERITVYTAAAKFPGVMIEKLAINAPSYNDIHYPLTPCGNCLQVLSEIEQNQHQEIPVILSGDSKYAWKAGSIRDFLPFPFNLKFE